jgi:flagellar hook-associated protein 2
MALSLPGVGSNLDVNSIVSQLMAVEKQPIQLLDTKEAAFQAKVSAFGSVQSALSAFKSSIDALNTPSKFQGFSATAADTTVLTATASSIASAGTVSVQVDKLAQSQVISTAGRANVTDTIGAGTATTLTFQFGTISGGTLANGLYTGASFAQDAGASSGTVTINDKNNSLTGIRDAINAANVGVKASIINDGSATNPNRLVLQATGSGGNRSMKISVSGDAALSTLLSQDPAATQNLAQSQAAQNASLSVNGIALISATNTVSGAVQGVTLNLLKTGSTTVSIARDTSGIGTLVQAFVKTFNDLNQTIQQLSGYDATAKQGGVLIGDSAVRSIQARIRDALTLNLSSGSLKNLSQVGVTLQRDGSLAFDSSKLSAALASDASGVLGLFSTLGTATDSLVSVSGSTAKTKSGVYAVNISALATQGSLVGTGAAGLTISAGSNNQFSVSVDGTTASVTLAAGSYTADTLATALQSAINGAAALSAKGLGVTVTQSAGVLSIKSNSYGSGSKVLLSGTGAANALGGTPVPVDGTDVAGTINGSVGVGSGQFLTGAKGNSAEGLKLLINNGSIGDRGTVKFSSGYATYMSTMLDDFLSDKGIVKSRTTGLNASIKDIDHHRDVLNQRLVGVEARYRAMFTRLDTTLAKLTSDGNFLTQQLQQLSNLSKG